MKAAYGTFLTALLVEYCHDAVADQAASKYNVSWNRTSAVVFSVCDDAQSTYMTGESDHGMGMSVTGDSNSVKAFRFACSSSISPLEYYVFSSVISGSVPQGWGTVTIGLGQRILNGEPLDMFMSNGYVVIKDANQDDYFLIVDPSTGIVRDGAMFPGLICGVYCFHNEITDRADQLSHNVINPSAQPVWLGVVGDAGVSAGSVFGFDASISELAAVLGSNPIRWVAGLAIGFAAVDGYLIATYPNEAVPANLEAMPGIGTLLAIYSLQSVLQGKGDPLTPENLAADCQEGAYLLLVLSEYDDFDNTINELEQLYIAKDFNPNDQFVVNQGIKTQDDINNKERLLSGLGGNDDPDKWKKQLSAALNKAVTEKKWTKAAIITAAGLLYASYEILNTLVNHK